MSACLIHSAISPGEKRRRGNASWAGCGLGDRRDQGRLGERELWRLPRTRPIPEAFDDWSALPLIFSEALVPEDHCAAMQPQPDADFVDRDRVGGSQNDPGSVC